MAKTTRRCSGLSLVLNVLFGFGSAAGYAADIKTVEIKTVEIFTTTDRPVDYRLIDKQLRPLLIQYYELDLVSGIEAGPGLLRAQLAGLDPRQLLQKAVRPAMRRKLVFSARGILKAMNYGLKKYPAIVINHEVVVYGVQNLAKAILIYRQRFGG